jgi:hypothetical protein
MSKLPAFITENKKLSIVLLIVVVLIITLLIISQIDFSPEKPTVPETVIDQETEEKITAIDSTERKNIAVRILDFFDNTIGNNGLYASQLQCDYAPGDSYQNQLLTAKSCRAINSNSLAGLALLWGRFQTTKTFNSQADLLFLQEDLANYYALVSFTSSSSATLLNNVKVPICSYLHEISQSPMLDDTIREQASAICNASNYASPSAVLVSDDYKYIISDDGLNNWLDYLTESILKGDPTKVTDYLPDLYTATIIKNSNDGVNPGLKCKIAALVNLLGEDLSNNETLNNLKNTFSDTWDIARTIDDNDLQSLANCSLALPNININYDSKILLQNKIYNAWQNQQTTLKSPVAPAPFVSEAFNNGSSWVIDVAQNGLLIGGLSQYN